MGGLGCRSLRRDTSSVSIDSFRLERGGGSELERSFGTSYGTHVQADISIPNLICVQTKQA
jgi:hypothetical protein